MTFNAKAEALKLMAEMGYSRFQTVTVARIARHLTSAFEAGRSSATPSPTGKPPVWVESRQSPKRVGDKYRVLSHRPQDSGFSADEMVRFIGGEQNDKYEHLDGRAQWYLSDESVELVADSANATPSTTGGDPARPGGETGAACGTCGGDGEVPPSHYTEVGTQRCPTCKGTGKERP